MSFSAIAIIFNPNSTGSADELAEGLKKDLAAAGLETDVQLTPTEHAGHAIDLAYELAKKYDRPLIISSSGDGGYNEVVNGALKAQREGANPVCAVLAAGNANDHSNSVGKLPLVEAIKNDQTQKIDVLEAAFSGGKEDRTRFAHSYLGLGLTPTVAVELNRNELNRIKETWIVYKTLKDLQPVEITVNGKRLVIDSLVLANINRMAKVLTIADNATPDDGLMNVTIFPNHERARLIFMLVKAILKGVKGKQVRNYEFTAVKDMVLQCDGEVEDVVQGEKVSVTVRPGLLTTLK